MEYFSPFVPMLVVCGAAQLVNRLSFAWQLAEAVHAKRCKRNSFSLVLLQLLSSSHLKPFLGAMNWDLLLPNSSSYRLELNNLHYLLLDSM